MAADVELIRSAFRESETRARANVPSMKPLYESQVREGRRAVGMITGVMKELKQDELNRIAGKDAQLQEFTKLVDIMDKKLSTDKEPLPQKVIIAIENGIENLQAQFDIVISFG